MRRDESMRWEDIEEQGSRLRLEGKPDEARPLYESGLRLFPGNPVLLNGLGLVLLDLGLTEEAGSAFSSALESAPRSPALFFNLGNALRIQGEIPEAIEYYRNALSLGLQRPEVHNNLGIALQMADRWDDALRAFEGALAQDHHYLPALTNRGNALIQLGRPEDALNPLQKAAELQPGYADAHWLLSHALLVTGRLPEGWDEYEWRWNKMKAASYHRGGAELRWNGEDLSGKTILLYAEQGIGDAVQFVRYASLVKSRGARVVVECHAELVSLFRSIDCVSAVYARSEKGPHFDVACPLLSLPSVFRTRMDTIPNDVPYLRPEAARVARWEKLLEPYKSRLRVGLAWAGNAGHANDRKRSIPFERLAPLASTGGVQFISVQKLENGDARGPNPGVLPLVDWTGELHDFADTAALLSQLDLLITVDTAVAHVAGALGTPVWMMVPFIPDWRWFLHRLDSPWYPSMRLFRQTVRRDWGEVVSDVCSRLQEMSSG
jgi:Flp pilus assembly protein TadD